mmetsp:Transcript_2838/g.4051  ORF Transcript_2838/g.4051 Transcript_2838/m.4051 type:complete len:337 (-) Transcript_2838:253-1263(-)|eukprot:CAMPEP_0117755866 /NCGR_PEP_ID=MMETSP0947-20121206/13709_1 /TAXON_ID=44440 /ORGANISM="Chattonella subsalsa, Strain CCMP2191" /LENGTH=336 /DNA_ID=CAMNT_0005575287 /DNA_START=80 /DNA_END=1090 /DNA_ORIENTATION=+
MVLFPPNQSYTAFVCAITGSAISFVGSCFVMISSFKFPALRNFPFRMVALLAFADIGCNFAFFLGDGAESFTFRCYLQALSFIYFNLASIFLSAGIAYTVWLMIVHRSFDLAREREGRVYAVCFGLPALIACLPLITSDYGNTGAWCSITGDHEKEVDTGSIWMLVCFYIPLWLSIGYICYAYLGVYRVIQGVKAAFAMAGYHEGSGETKSEPSTLALGQPQGLAMEYSKRLFLYPLIIVVCYSFASINKIYMLATGNGVFTLYLLQFTFLSLSGFGDALVYGSTKSVRDAWKNEFRQMRGSTWGEIALMTFCMGTEPPPDEITSPDPSRSLLDTP